MTTKRCPLNVLVIINKPNIEKLSQEDFEKVTQCTEELCGWWNTVHQKCGISVSN